VAELHEEVSSLRSIRESGRETDCCNRTLPSLGQAQQADRTHDAEDALPSLHLAECSDLRDRRQWQQVPAWCSRRVFSMTTSPSQVPLHSRYKAVQVEPNNDEDDGSSRLEVSPRLNQPTLCVNTASMKEKRWVIVNRGLSSEGNRRSNIANWTYFLEKPAASLGPGLKL